MLKSTSQLNKEKPCCLFRKSSALPNMIEKLSSFQGFHHHDSEDPFAFLLVTIIGGYNAPLHKDFF